jgi:hypothetical protein
VSKKTDVAEIIAKLDATEYGENCVIVYQDTEAFRKIYTRYAKSQLEKENAALILLPFYETADRVVQNLVRMAGVDAAKYQSEGFLLVTDARKYYMDDRYNTELLIKRFLSHAVMSGKQGISVIADMGAFFFIDGIKGLVSDESVMPAKPQFKIKGFCSYHKQDFDRLTESQKKSLFTARYKTLEVS